MGGPPPIHTSRCQAYIIAEKGGDKPPPLRTNLDPKVAAGFIPGRIEWPYIEIVPIRLCCSGVLDF
jgi:hypothetical protein